MGIHPSIRMGEEAVDDYELHMVCYGGGSGDDDGRVMEWESGLPGDDELTPLSQPLVPPGLAAAFRISSEPRRTLLDVHRASAATVSRLRRAPLSSSVLASSVLASSRRRIDRATRERTGNRARCLETWGGAPGKTRGSGCPPPPRRLPNDAIIWPVASFRAGFSPREKAGILEGFPAPKVGLSAKPLNVRTVLQTGLS